MEKKIFTQYDSERLRALIEGIRLNGTKTNRKAIDSLEKELERAAVVEPDKIPDDVVTMHSSVHLRKIETGEEFVYELVFPSEANINARKISILAPIGAALLGQGVGNVIELSTPSGHVEFKIEKIVYQPEAAGKFDR